MNPRDEPLNRRYQLVFERVHCITGAGACTDSSVISGGEWRGRRRKLPEWARHALAINRGIPKADSVVKYLAGNCITCPKDQNWSSCPCVIRAAASALSALSKGEGARRTSAYSRRAPPVTIPKATLGASGRLHAWHTSGASIEGSTKHSIGAFQTTTFWELAVLSS